MSEGREHILIATPKRQLARGRIERRALLRHAARLAMSVGAAYLVSACAHLPGGGSGCVAREGDCFDVSIADQPAVPLDSRAMLRQYAAAQDAGGRVDLDRTRWRLAAPIAGLLSLRAAPNARGARWFGDSLEAELQIRPLGGQDLATSRSERAVDTVTVQGQSAVVEENVLRDDQLPPGPYLFMVTLRGSGNWDRKYIFAQVR
jgi:hypothetical protein